MRVLSTPISLEVRFRLYARWQVVHIMVPLVDVSDRVDPSVGEQD